MDTSKQKPDLMAPQRATTERQRILANLEHGAKATAPTGSLAKWQLDGWTIALAVLVVFLSVMAWMAQDNSSLPMMRHKHYDSESASVAQAPAPAPDNRTHTDDKGQSTAVAVAAKEGKQPEQTVATTGGLAAAIVNEAAAPDRPTTHSIPSTQARPLISQATQHPAFNNTAHTDPRPVVAATAGRPALPAHRPTASSPAIPAASANGSGGAASSRTATATNAATADTDVVLLTALRAHDYQPATVVPERSRDVVERHEGDSTTSLLARCKQLGLIEGLLCKSRICSGRWENDAACRAPGH